MDPIRSDALRSGSIMNLNQALISLAVDDVGEDDGNKERKVDGDVEVGLR